MNAAFRNKRSAFYKALRTWKKQGRDVDERDRYQLTALYYACQNNNCEMAEALLKRDANPNVSMGNPMTFPLYMAVENGNEALAKLLVRYRASPNFRNPRMGASNTAFWLSLFWYRNLSLAQYFIDHGANVNDIERFDHTCVLHNLRDDDIDMALLVLRNGCRPNVPDENSWTPLHRAAKYGNALIAEALLQHGANVNAQKRDGFTPLHLATLNNNHRTIEVLLRYGADDTIKNHDGHTPDLSAYYASLHSYHRIKMRKSQ